MCKCSKSILLSAWYSLQYSRALRASSTSKAAVSQVPARPAGAPLAAADPPAGRVVAADNVPSGVTVMTELIQRVSIATLQRDGLQGLCIKSRTRLSRGIESQRKFIEEHLKTVRLKCGDESWWEETGVRCDSDIGRGVTRTMAK